MNEDCLGVVVLDEAGLPCVSVATNEDWEGRMNGDFHCVYILRSTVDPERFYVGLTADLKARLAAHNRGEVSYTASYRPWQIETAVAFRSREKAAAFEKYLKSHSGRAFSIKHF